MQSRLSRLLLRRSIRREIALWLHAPGALHPRVLHAGTLHALRLVSEWAVGERARRIRARLALPGLSGNCAAHAADRGLCGADDQAATVEVGIVHELPLAIFLLFVEFVDALLVAGTGDADN